MSLYFRAITVRHVGLVANVGVIAPCRYEHIISRYVKRGKVAARKRKLEKTIKEKLEEVKALRHKLSTLDEDDDSD